LLVVQQTAALSMVHVIEQFHVQFDHFLSSSAVTLYSDIKIIITAYVM